MSKMEFLDHQEAEKFKKQKWKQFWWCRFCGAIWRFSAPKIAKNRPKSGPKIAELMQIGAENRQKSPKIAKIMPKWCKSSPTFGKGVNCAWHCSKETILDYVHIIFSSSIEIIYWSLKSSFWRDFRRRKSSNNIHFRPLMKQIRPLHKIGP